MVYIYLFFLIYFILITIIIQAEIGFKLYLSWAYNWLSVILLCPFVCIYANSGHMFPILFFLWLEASRVLATINSGRVDFSLLALIPIWGRGGRSSIHQDFFVPLWFLVPWDAHKPFIPRAIKWHVSYQAVAIRGRSAQQLWLTMNI